MLGISHKPCCPVYRQRSLNIKMSHCCIKGCSNTYTNTRDRDLAFYVIPKKPQWRRKLWFYAIRRDWKWEKKVKLRVGPSPKKSSSTSNRRKPRVCGDHFLGGHKSENQVSVNYIPTLMLPKPLPDDLLKKLQAGEFGDKKINTIPECSEDDTDEETPMDCDYVLPSSDSSSLSSVKFIYHSSLVSKRKQINSTSIGIQTDPQDTNILQESSVHGPDHNYSFNIKLETSDDKSLQQSLSILKEKMEQMKKEIDVLREREGQLMSRIAALDFSLDRIKDSDDLVKFYTGFTNYETLMSLYNVLEPKCSKLQYWRRQAEMDFQNDRNYQQGSRKKPGKKRKFSYLEEFFMVLVRLRVGLLVEDISVRFNIDQSHFSRIYTTWINFLACELQDLFPWPDKETIKYNMPAAFDRFPDTRVIIDCSEIFLEVPSSLTAQAESWSNYKHHNTLKVLIGITPNGLMCFVSDLWGGRVSDIEITKQSEILSKCESGDNVMADRGFEIKSQLPEGVHLNMPPFMGGKEQLSPEETEDTMDIASVRIFVEIAIGRMKKFHILDGVCPISLSKVIDQTVKVCAYLTNFQPPLLLPKRLTHA